MSSIKPFYNITASITLNITTPNLLIDNNLSPHDFNLRPTDMKLISKSHLIIWGGAGLEPYLEKPLDSLSAINLDLSKIPGLKLLPLQLNNDNQKNYTYIQHDPHYWLDLDNVIIISKKIAQELEIIDPNNALKYRENLKKFIEQLHKKEKTWKKQLKPYQNTPYIVNHDAFQYFNTYFNLNGVGAITANHELPSSVQHIKKLKKIIHDKNIICIFNEPQFSNKMINNIISNKYNKYMILDPLGQDEDLGSSGYFILIDKIINNFVSCIQIHNL